MRMIIVLAVICCTLQVSMADEATYSDHSPRIQRLQGVILYPYNIAQETVQREGEQHAHYKYNLMRLEDVGQDVDCDMETFAAQNKGLMVVEMLKSEELAKDATVAAKIDELSTLVETKLVETKLANGSKKEGL